LSQRFVFIMLANRVFSPALIQQFQNSCKVER
jgi:hypothetical protein